MSCTVQRLATQNERWSSSGSCISCEIPYMVFGVTTRADAVTAVLAVAPGTYDVLIRSEVRIEEESETSLICTVSYEQQDENDKDDDTESSATMSFDCSGGTKHITHSLSNEKKFPSTAKSAGNAIGWNGKVGEECEIKGVDVPTANMRETYTKTILLSRLTNSYKRSVASLVGAVNSSTFKGWNAGEVMFLGMSYSTPSDGSRKTTATYNFSIQPNESNVDVAGVTISKLGYEYAWTLQKQVMNANAASMEVDGVYVDQVCRYADFSVLGL